MFLKNFIFLKKQTKNNSLLLNNFKNYYFYYFYNIFYLFYFLNFFNKLSITNLNTSILNKNSNLFKISSLDDELKKKRFFFKFFFYSNVKHKNIHLNQLSFFKINKNKINFFKKLGVSNNRIILAENNFYKTKKSFFKSVKKINFNFFYISVFFYNFLIKINCIFSLIFHFEKNNFKKHYHFYKNIFKNFFFIKNNNHFFLNKNYYLLNNNLLDNFKINLIFYEKINFVYNNQYPLIFFKKFNNRIFNKFNLKKKNNFLNLFNSYFLNFFEFFFKKNFFLKISNKIQLNNIKKLSLFLQNYNNNIKYQKFFDSNEMIELICIVFLYKDLTLFKNWLIFMLNSINIKNHKKFFIILNEFIVDNFSLFSNIFSIKGFYFCVKGKIGLSGNAKKKKFFFKKGLLKVSSKNFKIDNQRFFIKTNCGSLGVNMILSY